MGSSTTVRFPHLPETQTQIFIMHSYASSDPVFQPTGSTNRRKARCARCKRALAKGTGFEWRYEFPLVYNAGPTYFCEPCHNYRVKMLAIRPAVAEHMDRIEVWCREYVTLGMGHHAARKIDALIGRCGLHGAEVAKEIDARLPYLRDTSFYTVVKLAEAVAEETVRGGDA